MSTKPRVSAPSTRPTVSARELRRLHERSLRQGTQALYESGLLFDHLYRRRRQDVRFYVEMAERYGGPVLELGVGTGRVAFALVRAGFDVFGIDAMPSMLEHARAQSARLPKANRERLSLRRADMRSVRLGRRFPLVIAPFNAFMHLYRRSDMERALARCRAHLLPRGRLVFDVAMPDLRALLQDPERLYACGGLSDPRDGQRYVHREASHYDPTEQVRSVTMLFERRDEPHTCHALPLTQRQFFPAELEALLHYNGFDVEQRYGDFARGPLSAHSEAQVIVARPRSGDARPRSRA